jgi:hypothetical protein
MNQYHYSIIGLSLDIIGVIILFKYGLPSDLNKKGLYFRVAEGFDQNEIDKYKRFEIWSFIGLGLIIIGFIFQLIPSVLALMC